jgi:hypothetical protein
MKVVVAAAAAAGALACAAMLGLLVLVPVVLSGGAASSAPASATGDIPPNLLALYVRGAASCGMPWEVLAAVGKVETDHGRSTQPGVHSGTNRAGAAGPMQFLGSTWTAYGRDGDGDGDRDVYSPADAIAGAAAYLCANGAADPVRVRGALWHYNHDGAYVDEVLRIAASYVTLLGAVGTYRHPLPSLATETTPAPHHDYPALDLPAPVGTLAVAVTSGRVQRAAITSGPCGGTVVLVGEDGHRYTYCHASEVLVEEGARVVAGQALLLTGGRPGSRGAGRSTGPHLHLAVYVGGVAVCPQRLVQQWAQGIPADPAGAPRDGCTT